MATHAVPPGARRTMGDAARTRAGLALRTEVAQTCRTLEQLVEHRALLGDDVTGVITDAIADVRRRLDREQLAVAVVGENKAGKSTFLNAVLGAQVLGTAVRECTGTVTFLRWAPRAGYRATLRDGSVLEFRDIEAAQRTAIAHEIDRLAQRLGEAPPRIARRSGPFDAALDRATVEHAAATRARGRAEAAERDCEAAHRRIAADAERSIAERDSDRASMTRLDQQLVDVQTRCSRARHELSSSTAEAHDYARQHGLTLSHAIDARHAAAAVQRLAAAEARLTAAAVAVPFFLHRAAWWAFWIVLLRIVFGWQYRLQVEALDQARRQRRLARLAGRACEAAERVDRSAQEMAHSTSCADAARHTLARSARHAAEIADELRGAEANLSQARAALASAHRTEDRSQLAVLQVRSEILEDACLTRFRGEVHALTDMEQRGHDVVELHIGFPAAHLPDGITIIDTPGVNTENTSNRERAWDVIRREADGCVLVADLQQVVSQTTREFVQEVRAIIPHILLVMSKVDRALASAAQVGDLEPWQQVEDARRAGVRRFAREVGRSPDDVFAIAVAAELALRGDMSSAAGLGGRFAVEVAKLFELLHSERAVVLAARAASALRCCVQRIAEAREQAELTYQQRISELENQRLPDPREFQARQLAKVEAALQVRVDAITRLARDTLTERVNRLQDRWTSAIWACASKQSVKATVQRLGSEGTSAMASVMASVGDAVGAASRRALHELEDPLLEELRVRYRIVQQLTGGGLAVPLAATHALDPRGHATNLHVGVTSAVSQFENQQLAIQAGGAVTGAVLGSLVLPGIGTVIGAALGTLVGLFKTLDSLKRDCTAALRERLDEVRYTLDQGLVGLSPDMQRDLQDTLARGLAGAVARFQSWIDQLMEAERAEIEHERRKLSHLLEIRDALVAHDQELAALHRSAAATSRGLCA